MTKKLIFILSLCMMVTMMFGIKVSNSQGKYTLEDLEQEGGVNLDAADYFLNKNFYFARVYPPRIDSQAQYLEIEKELKTVISVMESELSEVPDDVELLWRLGYASTMTYNLDWPGSKTKIKKYFDKLFEMDPEHKFGHLYYGAHLAQTGDKLDIKESISHLEKAYSYGFDVTLTMLGIAYMQTGDNVKALEYFKRFRDKFPNDKQINMLIEGIEQGDDYTVHSVSVDKNGKRKERKIESLNNSDRDF